MIEDMTVCGIDQSHHKEIFEYAGGRIQDLESITWNQ